MFSCSRIFGWGEGGENFAGVVRRINPLIDSVLGQADDIMVDNNYQRVKKRLDEFEGQRQSLGRKNMLDMRYNDALMQLQSNPDALYKDKVFLDKTSPDFQQHEAFTRYNNYKAMQDPNALGPDGKPVAPMSIDDFINSDNVPSTVKEDLIAKGLLQQSKVQLDDNELQNLITTTAGLTAEDIAFRNEMNAKNLNTKDYNREVAKYIQNSEGDLTSRGRLANSLFKRTVGLGQDLQILPNTKEFKYEKIGDDLYQINNTDGSVKKVVAGDGKITHASGMNPRIIEDKNSPTGYSYKTFNQDKKGNIKPMVTPGATESEWQNQLSLDADKQFTQEDAINKNFGNKISFRGMFPGGSSKKKGSGSKTELDAVDSKRLSEIKEWGISGDKWAKMNDTQKNDYIIKEKQLADLYFKGDVKKLQEVKEKIISGKNEKQQKQAYLEYINGEDTDGTDTGGLIPVVIPPKGKETAPLNKIKAANDIIDSRTAKMKKEFSNIKEFDKSTLKLVNSVADKVNQRIKDTITSWGRSDLTPEQWKQEILKVNWTGTELGILKIILKENGIEL